MGLRPADPACLLSRGLSLGTGNEAGGDGVPTKILVEGSPHIQGPLDSDEGRSSRHPGPYLALRNVNGKGKGCAHYPGLNITHIHA